MELLKRLQNWYKLHCDGDWEHSYGVVIDTLDNPGWQLSVDLTDTLLEDVEFPSVCMKNKGNKNGFWLECKKIDKTFIGMGCTDSLEKILSIFLDWAESNSDTSDWNTEVNTLIQQCQNCDNVDEFRCLYRRIDTIRTEHPQKQELKKLFDKKWRRQIDNIEK